MALRTRVPLPYVFSSVSEHYPARIKVRVGLHEGPKVTDDALTVVYENRGTM